MQVSQQSVGGKAVLPPHALALYQQQITMAHGESSQEARQQQHSSQPGKLQPYNPQADREREALHSSSPRVRPRSPPANDKDGTDTSMMTHNCLLFLTGSSAHQSHQNVTGQIVLEYSEMFCKLRKIQM